MLFLEGDRLFYQKKIHCSGHVKTKSSVRSGPGEGGDRLSHAMSVERGTRGSLAPHTHHTITFRHFVKAADQSCRLEEGCSSARRAPFSYNGSSSFPQRSAGYALGVMKTSQEEPPFSIFILQRRGYDSARPVRPDPDLNIASTCFP